MLANEDYSGRQPNAGPEPGSKYLDSYRAVLDAAERPIRSGSSPMTPMSSGTRATTTCARARCAGASGITRLAIDTQNAVRDFLDDGGKLFFTGKNAGLVFTEGYTYNPFQVEQQTYCQNANPSCIIVQDDFLQYWLGAYRQFAAPARTRRPSRSRFRAR